MDKFDLSDYSFEVLLNNRCKALTDNSTAMTDGRIEQAMKMLFLDKPERQNRWKIVEIKGIQTLRGAFGLRSFEEAYVFVSVIYKISMDQSYYPDITFGDGFVYVSLFTIKLNGLHENDFIMLAKIDNLIKDPIVPIIDDKNNNTTNNNAMNKMKNSSS